MLKKWLSLFGQAVFCLLLISLSNSRIFSQHCVVPSVCQAYSYADAVFVGKLARTEPDKLSRGVALFAYFSVEKIYKGKTERVEKVRFVTGICPTIFTVGEKYFVYKQKVDPVSPICNMSDVLSKSSRSADYAKSLSKSRPSFTIRGWIDGITADERRKTKVTISHGREQTVLAVEDDGIYSFTAKENAVYKVSIILPFQSVSFMKNLSEEDKFTGDKIEYLVRFRPNECDDRDFHVQPNQTATRE